MRNTIYRQLATEVGPLQHLTHVAQSRVFQVRVDLDFLRELRSADLYKSSLDTLHVAGVRAESNAS